MTHCLNCTSVYDTLCKLFKIGSLFYFRNQTMGKSRNISSEKVAQLLILRNVGLILRQICGRLNLSHSSVLLCLSRQASIASFQHRKSPGRPWCTTSQTDRMIKIMVVSNPTKSASEILGMQLLGEKESTNRLAPSSSLAFTNPAEQQPISTQLTPTGGLHCHLTHTQTVVTQTARQRNCKNVDTVVWQT